MTDRRPPGEGDPAGPQPAGLTGVTESIDRISSELKRRIAGAGYSQKAVERKLGWGDGYISQILRGKVGFKFKHLFAILDVIEVDPDEFFRGLFESGALDAAVSERQEPPREEPDTEMIRGLVQEIIAQRLGRPQGA